MDRYFHRDIFIEKHMKRRINNSVFRSWAILKQELDGTFTIKCIEDTRKIAYEIKEEDEIVVQCETKIKLIERKRNA